MPSALRSSRRSPKYHPDRARPEAASLRAWLARCGAEIRRSANASCSEVLIAAEAHRSAADNALHLFDGSNGGGWQGINDRLSAYFRQATDGAAFYDTFAVALAALRDGAATGALPHISSPEAFSRSFAAIRGLGYLTNCTDAFSAPSSATTRTILGDWREQMNFGPELVVPERRIELYVSRGYDRGAQVEKSDFDAGMVAAGLKQEEDRSVELNVLVYRLLFELERELRRFLVDMLRANAGERWMERRVPDQMRAVWLERRADKIRAGREGVEPIECADFGDYRQIIERRDNWLEIFKPVFGRVEDVRESLQRLQPLRNGTAHIELVTKDDLLLVQVETRRILQRIRRKTN